MSPIPWRSAEKSLPSVDGFGPLMDTRVAPKHAIDIASGEFMPRRPAMFTQADVARIIRACQNANLTIQSVGLDDDKLTVRVQENEQSESQPVETGKTVVL